LPYQVDQSNKIESTGDTALALSNDREYTIRIPAREKREAIRVLRWHPRGRRRVRVYLRLFAVALYHLVRELPPEELVIIDTEYTGHEKSIKNMLLALLWRDNPDFNANNIAFGHVGKKSTVHKKALAVYRGKAKADRTLTAHDLLSPITGS
jgi:DNA repair exonuclease SbcCD nuclease subunit